MTYNKKKYNFDEHDFSIHPLKQMRIIDLVPELDDECEFERNMYNFGDEEDTPDSDRATDCRCKNN